MEYDFDYEIYKYINEQAENYVTLRALLEQNNLTFSEARKKVQKFKTDFSNLLSEYNIDNDNTVKMYSELMERINENPGNTDLQYL